MKDYKQLVKDYNQLMIALQDWVRQTIEVYIACGPSLEEKCRSVDLIAEQMKKQVKGMIRDDSSDKHS